MPYPDRIPICCETCGITFLVQPHRRHRARFCSRKCLARMPKPARRVPIEARFWTYVDQTGECWLWTGALDTHGYGQIIRGGRTTLTHRLSWELHFGAIPDGLWVLHHCDVPQCCRPDHLFLGTRADNSADMARKGRAPRGQRHPLARVTDDQVRAIRAEYAAGQVTKQSLAVRYGVAHSTIRAILNRDRWKHVD